MVFKVSKGAEIRNRYNQVPHMTQDTNGNVTSSQLYATNESQEVSPFPAGDHKAHINRRVQTQSKHKPEKTNYRLMQVKSIAESSEGEHFPIVSIFFKVPFVIETFVLSIFECPFYTGFTEHVYARRLSSGEFAHMRKLA